jgi:hypothetical protein
MRVGQEIIVKGERGTVTRLLNSANEGTPLVEYRRREDGNLRVDTLAATVYWTKSNPNGSLFDPERVGVY